jgi:hypothetical protein
VREITICEDGWPQIACYTSGDALSARAGISMGGLIAWLYRCMSDQWFTPARFTPVRHLNHAIGTSRNHRDDYLQPMNSDATTRFSPGDLVRQEHDQPLIRTTREDADVVRTAFRVRLCGCGHDRGAHRHYRHGSDCALCDCPRWSARCLICQLVRRLWR